MIKVTVGNNANRYPVIVDENMTPRALLEQENIDYASGTNHLDGSTMKPGDLDKTFAELGIKEKCYLLNVVKTDNATVAA